MKESNKTRKLIGALLTAAAIGGLLGIFLAPRKGSKTLKKMKKKSVKFRDTTKEKFNNFIAVFCKDAETINEIEVIEIDPQSWRS